MDEDTRSAEHISIIHIESDIDALSALLLKEVARVKLRLSEALHVDELVDSRAVPDSTRIRFSRARPLSSALRGSPRAQACEGRSGVAVVRPRERRGL